MPLGLPPGKLEIVSRDPAGQHRDSRLIRRQSRPRDANAATDADVRKAATDLSIDGRAGDVEIRRGFSNRGQNGG